MSRDFFFLHIPKTAGTSFRLSLLKEFEENTIFPNRTDLKNHNGNYPNLKELDELINKGALNNIQLFLGHYNLEITYQHFKGAKILCFFRDPIDRAISNLKHLQKHNADYQNKSLEEISGLKENKAFHQINNAQTRMLGSGSIENKLERLEKIEFIGLTEMYKESIQLCNHTFGWNLPLDLKENTSSSTNEIVSKELLDFLIYHNRDDMAIYSKAKWIFNERYQKIKK
jgi:hypothetical protein